MWNEIQIQYSDAYEIADALMNNEVDLVQLESVPIFAAKARLVEEAVWDFAMVNQLKQIVGPKRHGGLGINDGSIRVIPFSIGDVFLQKLCLFNPDPAKRMVNMLMECSPAHKSLLTWIRHIHTTGRNDTKSNNINDKL